MVQILTILLSWNRPELLSKTIHSYYSTISVPYQFTVVDNGSNPETLSILDVLSKQYNFEVIYLHRNISGLAFNSILNRGVISAPFTHFSENDIEYRPGWDQELINKLNAFPNLGQISPYSYEMTLIFPEIFKAIESSSSPVQRGNNKVFVTRGNVGSSCLVRSELIHKGLRWVNDVAGFPGDGAFSDSVKRLGYHVAWNDKCMATHSCIDIEELQRNIEYYMDNVTRKGSATTANFYRILDNMNYKLEINGGKYRIIPK